MSRTLPISEVKAHLPELVVSVQEREEEIIVTRKGRAAAVILNFEEYERLRETLEILSDTELMANVRRGRSYFERGGKGIAMDRVFATKSAARKRSK
jgi:prevent-host-death family protein